MQRTIFFGLAASLLVLALSGCGKKEVEPPKKHYPVALSPEATQQRQQAGQETQPGAKAKSKKGRQSVTYEQQVGFQPGTPTPNWRAIDEISRRNSLPDYQGDEVAKPKLLDPKEKKQSPQEKAKPQRPALGDSPQVVGEGGGAIDKSKRPRPNPKPEVDSRPWLMQSFARAARKIAKSQGGFANSDASAAKLAKRISKGRRQRLLVAYRRRDIKKKNAVYLYAPQTRKETLALAIVITNKPVITLFR